MRFEPGDRIRNARLSVAGAISLLMLATVSAPAQAPTIKLQLLNGFGSEAEISEVCCGTDRPMREPPQESVQTEYGNDPFWIRVVGIEAGSDLIQFLPVVDRIDVYTKADSDTSWTRSTTGDTVSADVRSLASPFMVLPLAEGFDPQNVYARIVMPAKVTIRARQWAAEAFDAMQERDKSLKFFLFGFVSAVVLYNIVVTFVVRDPVFLVNACCIASLLVLSLYLSGYGVIYVWASAPQYSNTVLCFSMMSAVIFGGLFLYLFLQQSEHGGRWLGALLIPGFGGLPLVLAGMAIDAPYWRVTQVTLASAGLLLLIMTITVIFLAIKGEFRARLLAMPALLAVVPGLVLVALDKLAGVKPLQLGDNAMEVTLALEAILFSLVLATRVRMADEASRAATAAFLYERERSSSRALAAQDDERKRLARELHDSVGQELMLVVNRMKGLASEARSGPVSRKIADFLQSLTSIMQSLRQISRAMHPASLEHLGLSGAIEDLTDHLNTIGEIEFSHDLDIDDRAIPEGDRLHLYRIVQECASNVLRHSQASRCRISLGIQDQLVRTAIEDDGVGLREEGGALVPGFGLGMTSIDERVRSVNGKWWREESSLGGLAVIVETPRIWPQQTGGRMIDG